MKNKDKMNSQLINDQNQCVSVGIKTDAHTIKAIKITKAITPLKI